MQKRLYGKAKLLLFIFIFLIAAIAAMIAIAPRRTILISNPNAYDISEGLTILNLSETSDSVKRENFKQALQNQLSQNLALFDGISDAVVLLYLPYAEGSSTEPTNQPTANVVLNVSRLQNQEEGSAMALYLSKSVNGLEMDNIEIYDQNANIVYSGFTRSSQTETDSTIIQ